jgi:mannose-1-phosphate guanylyltransferase
MQEEHAIQFDGSDSHCHRWGAILAGGDGKRLLPLTRRITGDDRPKQFCAIVSDETLLHQTQRRISRLVPRWRTLLMLTNTHERFYADQIAGMPSSSVLSQPCNRGTTPAILYSLMRLCEMDPKGVVAFFPSDHYFSDDEVFVRQIDLAYSVAAFRPEMVILLGITPESPEVEYGWIEPGLVLGNPIPNSVCRVSRFWEKPGPTLALALMERGCLWNTFVMVGRVNAFLKLIQQALPALVESFESIRPSFFTTAEPGAVRDLYSVIHPTSFSNDILTAQPDHLAVRNRAAPPRR